MFECSHFYLIEFYGVYLVFLYTEWRERGTLKSFSIWSPPFALCRRSRDEQLRCELAGMVTLQPYLQRAVLAARNIWRRQEKQTNSNDPDMDWSLPGSAPSLSPSVPSGAVVFISLCLEMEDTTGEYLSSEDQNKGSFTMYCWCSSKCSMSISAFVQFILLFGSMWSYKQSSCYTVVLSEACIEVFPVFDLH